MVVKVPFFSVAEQGKGGGEQVAVGGAGRGPSWVGGGDVVCGRCERRGHKGDY